MIEKEFEKKYRIKLSDLEKATLNKVNEGYECNEMRRSLFSLYTYIVKYTKEGTELFEITFKLLHKKFTRWHDKNLKLTSLKERMKKLIDLGLIKVVKNGKKNSYWATRCVNFNPTENPTNEKPTPAIENTDLDDSSEIHKDINLFNNIDIDSNSETEKQFDYDTYIENSEKVGGFGAVLLEIRRLFTEMKVKSEYIKSKTYESISKCWRGITVDHLENYIRKVIRQKRKKSNENWNKYIAPQKFAKFLSFTNYEQRNYSKQDFKEIEEACSGFLV